MWIQWSALDIVLGFPLLVLRPDPPQKYPASEEVGDVAVGPSPQQHIDPTVIAGALHS